ncbi:MAG: hypothetical protein IIB61_04825, partial [Planctomycetes bacterium]|nr:hypothetical protein [Planctomycetota bacterium]
IDLLGQSGKADPVRAELVWDPAKLAWSIKDPAALSAYAATLAEESIREPLEKGVFEKSDALRPYRSAVSLSMSVVQPRDPGLWRDGIEFDVTLALRGGEGASVHSLQTFRAKCARLGSVTLDTDLKDAERALVGFVVAAQNQALARTTRDLTERIKRGPAKVKLIPDLKRIKQPVDRIEYEVRPKKGDRLQIAAPWDPARFDFPLPDGMKQRLDRLLAGESSDPSPATDTQRAAPKKDKAPAKPKQPAADRTKKAKTVPPKPRPVEVGAATISATSGDGGGRSRGAKKGRSGFVIFSVLGLVAAGTAGAIVLPKMFSSEDGGNTDQRVSVPIQNDSLSDDNANDTGESANDTGESANESIADASTVPQLASCRSQLQDLLSESDRLRVPAAGLVGSQDPAEETMRYAIPGLANGGRAAECAGTDGLSLADPDVIREAVRAMDRLLDEGWRDPVTDAVRSVLRSDYRDLIDENAGIVAADAPDWQLDTAKRAWSATFGGSVMVGSAPGAFSFDLPNLSLRAADGQVVVMNAAEPMPDLAAVFINLQKSAAQEAANRFQEQAGAELSISYLDFADPTTEMYVTIGDREDRVLQRTVLIPWSAENLDFVDSPQGLDRQLADARAASMLVAAVNGASGGELDDDWIERAAGDGLFREIESEGARVAVATPAPWSDEDDRRVGELAENQRLVIDLPVEMLMEGDSPVTYDDVIALGGPSVWREAAPWTLAMAYGDLVYAEDQPFKEDIDVFLREAQNLRDYLSRDDNRFRVELAFTRPAQPSDGGTPTLVVAGQWVPDPERNYDHDTDKLAEGLAKQIRANETGDAPQGFVSLGIVGGDVKLTFDAEAVATSLSEDLGYVLTLESELSAWSARRGAEEELEKALGDVGAIRLDDTRGMLLLTAIWTAKGKEDPGALGFAEFHSDKIPRRSVLKDIAPVRGKLRVTATVFVEYFAGTRATYAVVWSWKSDTSEGRGEGPWLLKLMDKESLDQFGGDLSSLGSTLIEPALNRVREAWQAESYGNQLGIALGVDVPLQHLPWSGMTFKMSNEVVLKTRKRLNIGVAEGSRPIGFDIGSLSDLRGPEVEDRACGYLLLTSLAPPCVELRNPPGNGDVFPDWARSVVLDAALPDG